MLLAFDPGTCVMSESASNKLSTWKPVHFTTSVERDGRTINHPKSDKGGPTEIMKL